MNFASDNGAGVAPAILEAIVAVRAASNAPAYGADAYTARAEARLSEIFERDGGGFSRRDRHRRQRAGARVALTRPWQAIFCHDEAHIIDDECGAPEFFTAGAKLVGIRRPQRQDHARRACARRSPAFRAARPRPRNPARCR